MHTASVVSMLSDGRRSSLPVEFLEMQRYAAARSNFETRKGEAEMEIGCV